MRYIEYNGVKSNDLSLHIYNTNWFSSPERDYSTQSIPGRDGDLILDEGRYSNLLVKYECDLKLPASAVLADRIKQWLMSYKYLPLFDSGDSEHFRYAIPVKPFSEITEESIWFGSVLLQFNCKPYRYKYTGQTAMTYEAPDSIDLYNPGLIYSCPTIEIIAAGDVELSCAGKSMALLNISGTIIIDAENKLIYNKENFTNLAGINTTDDFIQFEPGKNTFILAGNVSQVKITPNWRTL